jgi:hypothetical protein
MPSKEPILTYRFEFDPANRILRCLSSEVINDEGLTSFYRTVGKYAAWLDPRAAILDLSDVTPVEITIETVRHPTPKPPSRYCGGFFAHFWDGANV